MTAMIQALISPFRASFTYLCQFVHPAPTTQRNKKLYHIIDSFVLQMNENFRGKKTKKHEVQDVGVCHRAQRQVMGNTCCSEHSSSVF